MSIAYKFLGVSDFPTKAELATAYRLKAKFCHPDLFPNDEVATQKFIELNEMYELAKADLEKDGIEFEDETVHTPFVVHRLVRKNISVSLKDAMMGFEFVIPADKGMCTKCLGKKMAYNYDKIQCKTCRGSGSLMSSNGFSSEKRTCKDCSGTGYAPYVTCDQCFGFGKMYNQNISITLPAGIYHKEVFTCNSVIETKDVVIDMDIVVHIEENDFYSLNNYDITMEARVNVYDAVLGAKKFIIGPDGQKYQFVIPPGSHSGQKFIFKDHGLRKNTKYQNKGNLYIKIITVFPVGEQAKNPAIKSAYTRLKEELEAISKNEEK